MTDKLLAAAEAALNGILVGPCLPGSHAAEAFVSVEKLDALRAAIAEAIEEAKKAPAAKPAAKPEAEAKEESLDYSLMAALSPDPPAAKPEPCEAFGAILIQGDHQTWFKKGNLHAAELLSQFGDELIYLYRAPPPAVKP